MVLFCRTKIQNDHIWFSLSDGAVVLRLVNAGKRI